MNSKIPLPFQLRRAGNLSQRDNPFGPSDALPPGDCKSCSTRSCRRRRSSCCSAANTHLRNRSCRWERQVFRTLRTRSELSGIPRLMATVVRERLKDRSRDRLLHCDPERSGRHCRSDGQPVEQGQLGGCIQYPHCRASVQCDFRNVSE